MGLVDNSSDNEKLFRQLVHLVKRGRPFVHRSRALYWSEVRSLQRLGRRCLIRVFGEGSPGVQLFLHHSELAFQFLPARDYHVHKVEIIDGEEVFVVGGDEDRIYHLNKLDWNNALGILIEAAHRLRNDVGRHDHQPAFTPIHPAGNLAQGIAEGMMADIPLPVDHTDPRSILSDAARRRISDAHAKTDLIRARTLASIEARYRSEPDSDKTLFEYQTTGQTGVEWAEAKVQAAGAVLSIVRDEFRAAGKSGRELRQIMEGELEDAVYSLELTTIQRDLLWHELGLDRYAEQEPTSATQGIADGATRMRRSIRPEIEKFANDAFAVARDRILKEHADQQRRALGQAELTGNSGAYLPALIKCEAQHVRETILALADAYVEAYTIHGLPSDMRVDENLRAVARQVTAGAISGIRGHLRLRSERSRIAEPGLGIPWHLEIERSMDAALKEGLLRLKKQRIKAGEGREMPSRGDRHEKQLEDETKHGEARSDWLNQKLIDELLATDTEAESKSSEPSQGVDQKGTEGPELPTEAKSTVGMVGLPFQKPLGKVPDGIFATNPHIRKLLEERPETLPYLSLIAHLEKAQAEAEVAFRKRETTERWASWSGVHPWDDKPDLETTDCPWWIAGAEYAFHIAAVWRNQFPAKPERTRELLPAQVRLIAKAVYNNKVFFHDGIYSKTPKAEDLFGSRNAERFADFAFLFAMKKFAEEDLRDWEQRAAQTTGAITDLKAEHSSAQPVASDSDPSRAAAQENPTSGEAGPNERSDTNTPAAHSPRAPVLASHKTPPRRTPDLKSIRERLELADSLARELAIVKQEIRTYCTVEALKRKYPKFTLWTFIEDSQIKELVEGKAFTPKAYAENLMLTRYGLTSRETLKKYRQKIRQADKDKRT